MNHALSTDLCELVFCRHCWSGVCVVPSRFEKDDLVVFLSFHGESDGRLLAVEML